jgi:restriction endonuclease S subunit
MKPQVRTIASLIQDGSLLGLQDGNHGGDHPKASEYVTDGIPFVMASDIRDGRLNLGGCQRLRKERTDRLRIGFAKTGDVLLTHKGTVGEVCITPQVSPYVMLTPQVTYYRVNPEKLDNRYLCAALRGRLFRQQLDEVSPQSTRPYVPISTQKGLRIEWYPLETQRLIARRVAAYDDLIENNTRRIAILEEMARRIFEEWFVQFRAPGCQGLAKVDSASVRAPVGRINIALNKLVIGRGVAAIRSNQATQSFLLSQLRGFFHEEDQMGHGTIFKAIGKDDLRNVRLLCPPTDIANAFDKITEPLWSLIKTLTLENRNLRAQRDLLLPKLISGEIDVNAALASLQEAAE